MNGQGLRKTSSPKFVVPQVRRAGVGLGVEHREPLRRAGRGRCRRSTAGRPGRSARAARATVSLSRPGPASAGARRRGRARGSAPRPPPRTPRRSRPAPRASSAAAGSRPWRSRRRSGATVIRVLAGSVPCGAHGAHPASAGDRRRLRARRSTSARPRAPSTSSSASGRCCA